MSTNRTAYDLAYGRARGGMRIGKSGFAELPPPSPTKQEVFNFITEHGCTPSYSGNQKTIYITGENSLNVELSVLKQFRNVPWLTQALKPIDKLEWKVLCNVETKTWTPVAVQSTLYINLMKLGPDVIKEGASGTESFCKQVAKEEREAADKRAQDLRVARRKENLARK